MIDSFKQVSWANSASIYEVNIRQYTAEGTFKAFEKHLPRIKEMGIDIIWLMPITPISQVNKKGNLGSYYACSSYTKINPEFGTAADFKDLVDTAQALGLKVVIDWVANHTGSQHEWMQENPNWFAQDAAGNFTERNGWDDVVDLNFDNPSMRIALIDAMEYWVHQFNIDGFRCDMAHLVPLDFWITARTNLEKTKILYWLAECEDIAYHQVFDTSYAWAWMHASKKVGKEVDSLQEVYNVLHQYAQYPKGAYKLFFTMMRIVGMAQNMKSMVLLQRHGLCLRILGMDNPYCIVGKNYPIKKGLLFLIRTRLNGRLNCLGFIIFIKPC